LEKYVRKSLFLVVMEDMDKEQVGNPSQRMCICSMEAEKGGN
jgi:hypothetical protein